MKDNVGHKTTSGKNIIKRIHPLFFPTVKNLLIIIISQRQKQNGKEEGKVAMWNSPFLISQSCS